VILLYRPDSARLKARLRHPKNHSDARVAELVVRYGTNHIVSPLEAERYLQLVSATRQELADLKGAGYDIPLARDFTEVPA